MSGPQFHDPIKSGQGIFIDQFKCDPAAVGLFGQTGHLGFDCFITHRSHESFVLGHITEAA